MTPSSRGSPLLHQRDAKSDGRRSAPLSKRNTPCTIPEVSPRPSEAPHTRSGESPPVSGGTASGRQAVSAAPTQQEYQDAVARDAYYPQSLFQLGKSKADRISRRNATGSFRCAPSARCVPLVEAREADMARGSNYRGTPTPNAQAERRATERKHGDRVYDASNAIMLRRRLLRERPVPPDQPRDPLHGFDEGATARAKRGYKRALREVEVSAASSHGQWMSYVRMERQKWGGRV